MKIIKSIAFLVCFTWVLIGESQVSEHIVLFTDRDVYVSSEEVFAEVYLPQVEKSKIVYVDLANYSGNHITGITLKVDDSFAKGVLVIPDSLKTGTYLLRAFLNQSETGQVFAKEVFVANRFEETFQNGSYFSSKTKQIQPGLNSDELIITGLPNVIGQNKTGAFEIVLSNELKDKISGKISVLISKVCENYSSRNYMFDVGSTSPGKGIIEDRGIVITGKVFNPKNNQPVANSTVFLSVPDSIPDFNYFITNYDGLFYFKLKEYYGLTPMVIQCYKEGMDDNLKLEVFNTYKIQTPLDGIDSVKMDDDFKEYLNQQVQAVTFKKVFNQQFTEARTIEVDTPWKYPFYGEPSHSVIPGLYVDLDDFSEISKEILPGVKFRERQGELSLNVINLEWNEYYWDPPFLMIDGVPVRDLEIIKDFKSTEIERIDISLEDRFFGGLNFPGVVAIYTEGKDNSRIIESDKLLKINFDAVQPPTDLIDFEPQNNNIPDLRQVLVWKTNINPAINHQVSFKTSHIKGKFKCCVRAKTYEGDIVFSEMVFEVK